MNYNFPVGYQPYQMNYPQYQQQNYAQSAQPQQQSNGMIFVNNQKEAEDWLIQRGETVILWDKNRPVFYIKAADNRGLPLPIEVKEYHDVAEEKLPVQTEDDTSKYVTSEEFEKRLAELNKQIFELISENSNRKEGEHGKLIV